MVRIVGVARAVRQSIARWAFGVMLLAVMPATAFAEWQSGEVVNGAWTYVDASGARLDLACNAPPGRFRVFLNLSGRLPDFPGLQKVDDALSTLMVWIRTSNGEVVGEPITFNYFAPDQVFVARLPPGQFDLDRFGRGERLMITTSRREELVFDVHLVGTARARALFRANCGV